MKSRLIFLFLIICNFSFAQPKLSLKEMITFYNKPIDEIETSLLSKGYEFDTVEQIQTETGTKKKYSFSYGYTEYKKEEAKKYSSIFLTVVVFPSGKREIQHQFSKKEDYLNYRNQISSLNMKLDKQETLENGSLRSYYQNNDYVSVFVMSQAITNNNNIKTLYKVHVFRREYN